MKLFVKKAAPKSTAFTAINKSQLIEVKGGTDGIVNISQGLTETDNSVVATNDIPT